MNFKTRFLLLGLAAALLPACDQSITDSEEFLLAVTYRHSLSSTQVEGNNESHAPSISADGRFIAFESKAGNLVAGDSNVMTDVFVRDTLTNVTIRVSQGVNTLVPSDKNANGNSTAPVISSNGVWVAFLSMANNIVDDGITDADTLIAPVLDCYVRNIQTGQAFICSVDSAEVSGSAVPLFTPCISTDGNLVSFVSDSVLAVADGNGGTWDIYQRDVIAGTTKLVSIDISGAPVQGSSPSFSPSNSADGNIVAFVTNSVEYPGSLGGSHRQVYFRDMLTGAVTLVSKRSGPGTFGGNGHSTAPAVTADGQGVAFQSEANDLVGLGNDENGLSDIYARHVLSASTIRISISTAGIPASGGASTFPAVSSSGRYVAFSSAASNLVTGDNNNATDVFIRDTQTVTTFRVSVRTYGAEAGFGSSDRPAITADGLFVAWESKSTLLVDDDLNGVDDIFLRGPLH